MIKKYRDLLKRIRSSPQYEIEKLKLENERYQRSLGRIEAWARNYKTESKSHLRLTMQLVYEESSGALEETG